VNARGDGVVRIRFWHEWNSRPFAVPKLKKSAIQFHPGPKSGERVGQLAIGVLEALLHPKSNLGEPVRNLSFVPTGLRPCSTRTHGLRPSTSLRAGCGLHSIRARLQPCRKCVVLIDAPKGATARDASDQWWFRRIGAFGILTPSRRLSTSLRAGL
jgi:hypothetical protein